MYVKVCIVHTFIHDIHTYMTYIHDIHTYIHSYIHTYIHTYAYIHTYIHTFIHTYIHYIVHVATHVKLITRVSPYKNISAPSSRPLIGGPDSSEIASCSCDSNVVSLPPIRGLELGAEKNKKYFTFFCPICSWLPPLILFYILYF